MTTSNVPLQGTLIAGLEQSLLPVRSSSASFSKWCMAVQTLLDYSSVIAGICLSYYLYCVLAPGPQVACSWNALLAVGNIFGLFTVLVLYHLNSYEVTISLMNIREVEKTIRGVTLSFLAAVVALFFYEGISFSRWTVLLSGIVVLGILLLQRTFYLMLIRWMHAHEIGVRHVLLVGSRYSRQIRDRLKRNPRLGLVLAGSASLDEQWNEVESSDSVLRALGDWEDLGSIVAEHGIQEVIVADTQIENEKLMRIVRDCSRFELGLSIVPALVEAQYHIFSYQLLDGIPLARLRQAPDSFTTDFSKRILDLTLSALLVTLLLPVFVLVALLVRLDSAGPILFRQERVGKDGRLFRILKFRSMYADSPKFSRSPSAPNDPRITRIGRILRRTSIDELPQLFNVLAGDMSLVGPRPEMPYIVQGYGPVERVRMLVKPGITGLWQISSARAMPIHENIEYDLFYVEHRNFFLDLAILVSTVGSVLRGAGAC